MTGQLDFEEFFAWLLSDVMKELLSISLFVYLVERKKHKLADRSNLTSKLFERMSKLSKVERKYFNFVLVVTLKLNR